MNALKQRHKYDLDLNLDVRELGEFAYKVLCCIADHRWEEATTEIERYKSRNTHPIYVSKTSRLFEHCLELIQAIKTKRTFPNFSSLSQAKQQELHDKVRIQWEELKSSLKRLRMIERGIILEDGRSTVWVVKTFNLTIVTMLFLFMIHEGLISLGSSLKVLADDFSEWIFRLIGM